MASIEEEIELREQMTEVLLNQIRTGEKGIDADIKLYLEHTKLGKTIAGTSKAVSTFTGGIKDSAKAMGTSTGNFNDLSSVVTGSIKAISGLLSAIPMVGKAFSALGDAAAETATFAIGQVQANFESFTELSKAGQIGAEGITGMAERFRDANLPLATYTKLLTENSENLGFFSVSALQGGKTFSKTMIKMAADTGKPLRRLGLTVDEIGKTVVDFQAMQRRNGMLDTLNQAQITKGTMEYAKELDLIAKLTGKSREGLQKEREEAMSDARFRASLAELGNKEQEQHKSALSQITDPTLRRAYMDQLSGFTNSTASISMEIAGMGQSIRDAQALINIGGGDSTEAVNIMKKQALLATEVGGTFQQYAKVMESGAGVMGNFAALSDFAVNTIKSQKEIAEEQAKLMAAEGTKTDLLITGMQDMQAGIAEMNYFFVATDAATIVLSKFSSAMRDTIEFISDTLLTERSANGLVEGRPAGTAMSSEQMQKNKDVAEKRLNDERLASIKLIRKNYEEAGMGKNRIAEVMAPIREAYGLPPGGSPTKAADLVAENRTPVNRKMITPEMLSDKTNEIPKHKGTTGSQTIADISNPAKAIGAANQPLTEATGKAMVQLMREGNDLNKKNIQATEKVKKAIDQN